MREDVFVEDIQIIDNPMDMCGKILKVKYGVPEGKHRYAACNILAVRNNYDLLRVGKINVMLFVANLREFADVIEQDAKNMFAELM